VMQQRTTASQVLSVHVTDCAWAIYT
jgi:hypothetical protein